MDCSSSVRGRGVSVAGTPERGASERAVEFARVHGYRVDELVQIIEEVS